MRDDRGPRTPVAEGTSSPPMTRRSARAAKKAHEGDGNVTPRRERARTAPEAASTALIGDVEFINEEVKKKVETCAKRLDVIKEFASTTDEPASPFKGSYKHSSLGLIQLCCDRRLDYEFINEEVKKKVETCAKRLDVIKEFASTTDEPASPFKGSYKHLSLGLIQLCCDRRLGGQNFHDISNEAPFCFLGNIAAHAHLVKEKLEKFDNSLMEKLELKLALSEDNEEPNWIGGIIGALDGIKSSPQSFHSSRLCVTQEESLGLYHFHNQGCATSGRLSSGTNTEDRTLTQESGDVRSVEGEVCGAVLVDE